MLLHQLRFLPLSKSGQALPKNQITAQNDLTSLFHSTKIKK